jgi:hypothetical protein
MTPPDAQPPWLSDATRWPVVRRALLYALVVGAILIAINHGDAILAGRIGRERLLKIGLTVLVPYVVSTLSSVGAMRVMRASRPSN